MLVYFIALILLVVISGFFSSSETSMMAINRYRLKHRAEAGDKGAKRILKLLKRPDRLLGVILLGNTFANILASSLATLIGVYYFHDRGVIIATVSLTLIILVFAEVAPKTIAALYASQLASVVSIPLRYLLMVFYPIVWLVNTVANGLLRLCQIKVSHQDVDRLSHDELRTMVDTSSKNMTTQDKSMLLSVFDLKQVSVNDIMVPRNEIIGIDLDDDIEKILKDIKLLEHTRAPLYKGSIDNCSGLLHMRDIINLISENNLNHDALIKHARPAYFIPEHVSLTKQLLRFQKNKHRMALVVDEYGIVDGLITLDDILEEIVGEFTTDESFGNEEIRLQEDGSFLVDGSVTVRELNRNTKLGLSLDGPKTLNGLIVAELEAIPKKSASVVIQGYPVEILHVKDNCVQTARIKPKIDSNKTKSSDD
jgi:Mg2+/Co2+ transporter CorB